MSKYDRFRKKTGEASAKEKLRILRHESLHLIGTIRAYTRLLIDISENDLLNPPKELATYIGRINEASNDLLEITELLTDDNSN